MNVNKIKKVGNFLYKKHAKKNKKKHPTHNFLLSTWFIFRNLSKKFLSTSEKYDKNVKK